MFLVDLSAVLIFLMFTRRVIICRSQNARAPLSVEVVDQSMIEARGLNNVVEATRSMGGIVSGDSPAEPYSFGMRGFTRDGVQVLFDGISIGRSTLNMRPTSTHNLSRLEVVRGAAVLNAEGSPAGTLNIIRKKADPRIQDHIQSAYLSYGSYNENIEALELMGPSYDKGAYFLSVDREGSDGWVDRTESEFINAYGYYNWAVDDEISLGFTLDYSQDELPGYWGTPLVPASVASNPLRVLSTDFVVDKGTRYRNYDVIDDQNRSDSFVG